MDGVYLERAPLRLFYFPPEPLPHVVPAPIRDFSLLHPYNIPEDTYRRVMDISLPITIATVYATTVWWLNRVNKGRNYKPWRFSRSTAFLWFVVAHNVALAIFSGWVAVGMFRAISTILPPRGSPAGAAVMADALCKMHGPRGYGNAVVFDPEETRWKTLNRSVQLLQGTPDPADLGRLWNEGLAYYGWIFYLSKFYEVVDTMIILAKGKKSSLLQTYHHTGAMIGMWAGMRYMSPPIWCFVQVNSFIHTIMYSYYAACALGVRAPILFKRTLTTMQIIQLVFGASYGLIHTILAFDVPVETPYLVRYETSMGISRAASAVFAAPTGPYVATFLKKLALRAAGGEGLAKNIGKSYPSLLNQPASITKSSSHIEEEIKYTWQRARVHCSDTSGEVIAILLNVSYLIPLIYLFVRFFVRSYLRRAERPPTAQTASTAARLRVSGTDAVKGVQREIREAIMANQGSYSDVESSKTPASSALSTITTPSTTSAPRSGASTPPTIKPFTEAPVIDESAWFGTGNGSPKASKRANRLATPPDSPEPGLQDRISSEATTLSRHPQDQSRASRASLPMSPESELEAITRGTDEATSASKSNGSANRLKSFESNEKGQSDDSSKGARQTDSHETPEIEKSFSEANEDETIRSDEPRDVKEPAKLEGPATGDKHNMNGETGEHREHNEATVFDEVDANEASANEANADVADADEANGGEGNGKEANEDKVKAVEADATGVRASEGDAEEADADEADNDVEAEAQADESDRDEEHEDVTVSSLTVPRPSVSPSPSESRRNAEEAVRRAYEAADMATKKASEDDADSIISVETTLTIESMTNESLTEARRYEIPGVDEALDRDEKEAERELQPDHDGGDHT